MRVEVHLLHQAAPVVIQQARNAYQKGDLYCVTSADGAVSKFPIVHIFRVKVLPE